MNTVMHDPLRTRATAGLALLALAALVATCMASPALAHESKDPVVPWPGSNVYQRSLRAYAAPDVVLTDSEARPVRLRELLATSDPVMLNFVFTTCSTICPIMVRVFADLPARLGPTGKNLRYVSISIDPEHDTPAQMRAYAKNVGAGERWRFLTGRVQDVKAVQIAFGGYRGDKMNHEPLTLIRHAPDKPWVRIEGFANPDELAREYRKGLAP